jgi:hypothetical protein
MPAFTYTEASPQAAARAHGACTARRSERALGATLQILAVAGIALRVTT